MNKNITNLESKLNEPVAARTIGTSGGLRLTAANDGNLICGGAATQRASCNPLQAGSGSRDELPAGDFGENLVTVNAAIDRLKQGDVGAPFERAVVQALARIKALDAAEFQRARTKLKEADRRVAMSALDLEIKKAGRATGFHTAETHNGYASNLIELLTVDGHKPVATKGALFVVNPKNLLWEKRDTATLVNIVTENNDDRTNCKRTSDYEGIVRHSITMVGNDTFFSEAPVGTVCPSGFYRVVGAGYAMEPLTANDRQRVRINVTPRVMPTPLFNSFLDETFASSVEDEKNQQIALMQEIAGAMFLGLMPRHHKAVLFFDPYGRAGKGTMERILRGLVPDEFIGAVDPFRWNDEYYAATLFGLRLNVVGELPNGASIPSASFKSITGGDPITGRHPGGRPFRFVNEAAHIFMSNHLIGTTDQSEAFFTRWLIVEFPNSRLKSGLALKVDLAQSIIESELPGIARWALNGASRLLQNGHFSNSLAHNRILAKWRRSTNSLMEFIHEECELGNSLHINRAGFYGAYKAWAAENGRKQLARGTAYDLVRNNLALGISETTLNGYDIYRGISLKTSRGCASVNSVMPTNDIDVNDINF